MKAKVLVLTGMKDPSAPPADLDGFQKEMTSAGVDWHLTIYGEGWRAFTEPDAAEMASVRGVKYDPLLEKKHPGLRERPSSRP